MIGRDFRLCDAVGSYIAHLEQTEQSVSVQQLFEEFLKAKTPGWYQLPELVSSVVPDNLKWIEEV